MSAPRDLLRLAIRPRKTKAVRHLVKDVYVPVDAAERLGAGPRREDGDVGQRVHALRLAGRDGAVDDEPGRAVRGVREQVVGLEARDAGGGQPRAARVHAEVLPVVGRGAEALRERVPRVPVDGEVGARAV